MTASTQPRASNGRFLKTGAREAADVILSSPAAGSAHRAAAEFLDCNEQLEIVDHSIGAEKNGTVELHRMSEPDIARGNCWAVTNEVVELGADELEAEWVYELVISGQGHHLAVIAGYNEGTAVIDFTIRQFDADLPFPWTGSVREWKTTVEAATGTA